MAEATGSFYVMVTFPQVQKSIYQL